MRCLMHNLKGEEKMIDDEMIEEEILDEENMNYDAFAEVSTFIKLTEVKKWFKYRAMHNDNVYIKRNVNRYNDRKDSPSVYESKETYYFKDEQDNLYTLIRPWSATTSLSDEIRLVGEILEEADELVLFT